MPKNIILEVVSPERLVLSKEIDSIIVPASEGYLGILPGHAPLITGLEAGVIKYKVDGNKEERLAISGGFIEVFKNKATILADTAELSEEINLDRAVRAKERAEKRLKDRNKELDVMRAEVALQRALARIHAKEK